MSKEPKKLPIRIDSSDGELGLVIDERFWKIKKDARTNANIRKIAEITDARTKAIKTDSTELQILDAHESFARDILNITVEGLDFDKEAESPAMGIGALQFGANAVYTFLVGQGGQQFLLSLGNQR